MQQKPAAHIDIVESERKSRKTDFVCRVGQEIRIMPEVLAAYCIKDLEPLIDDLVLLAAAVAFSDRVVARRTSITWHRDLEVRIPVHNPDRWMDKNLVLSLTRALDLVTGDKWNFAFYRRTNSTRIAPQAHLPIQADSTNVMPYSDGLDSFAMARLLAAKAPGVPLVLVTTGNHRNRALDQSNQDLNRMMYRVAIPFRLGTRNRQARHRESSYRSRAFVFSLMAGIAAYLLNAETINIAESGQGALGPWLTPVGNEAPDVRMHPIFTQAMSTLFTELFGRRINHAHTQLWKTKGQTLRELLEKKLDRGWWLTSSCARDQRYVSKDNRRIQCGVCAGCLLRRQSLYACGLESRDDRYLWSNLSAPRLYTASGDRPTTGNDERQAMCAVLELDRLAGLSSSSTVIQNAAEDLAALTMLEPSQAEKNLSGLLHAHRTEWMDFRDSLGSKSFVNRWLTRLQ